MRKLRASVVLSSMVLVGWLPGSKAQNVGIDNPPTLNSDAGDLTYGSDNGSPGHIQEPSLDSPGLDVGVTLGQLYTDNLKLARGNQTKQSGWITQVQPFVKGAMSRPRFSGVFDYALNGYLYEKPAGHNQLTQKLNARGKLAVLPQHFFIDGTVRYGQQLINNELPGGSGTFFLAGNRANVGIATLSPYWQQDLGNVGTMSLRYTRGRVVYNDHGLRNQSRDQLNGIPNVTTNALQFNVASHSYDTWGWDVSYSEERLNPDFGPGWDFAVAKLGASYRVNPNLRLLVDGGKENRFLPDGTVQKLGAHFWDVGFQWSNGRDHFKFTTGHRFFGHSYELAWTHEAALLTTNVMYTERPSNANQELLGLNFGSGGLPPVRVGSEIPSLTERQPYLMKRLSASATYLMPRSRLRLAVYDGSRTYFVENANRERIAGAAADWFFNLGASTTLTPSLRWQRSEFRDGQTSTHRSAQVVLEHQINTKNFGSVRLRHDIAGVSSPSPGAHGYTANVLFVQWTHLF